MTDLRNRFRALDDLQTPDLWHEIEARAVAAQPAQVRALRWTLVALLLLALAAGGTVLVGSGILKLPVTVEASATPSPTPDQGAAPSWTATGEIIHAGDFPVATATLLL